VISATETKKRIKFKKPLFFSSVFFSQNTQVLVRKRDILYYNIYLIRKYTHTSSSEEESE